MSTKVTHTQQHTRLALGTGECQPKSHTHNNTLALSWGQGNVNQSHTHTTTHSPCPGDRGMSTKVTHTQQHTRLALETGECQPKSRTHNTLALPWRQGNVNQSHAHTTTHSPCPGDRGMSTKITHTHTTHSPCLGDRGMSTKVTHTQRHTRLALVTGECQQKSHTHNITLVLETGECQPKSCTHITLALPWGQGNVNQSHTHRPFPICTRAGVAPVQKINIPLFSLTSLSVFVVVSYCRFMPCIFV